MKTRSQSAWAVAAISGLLIFAVTAPASGCSREDGFDASIATLLTSLDTETDIGLADVYTIAGGSLAGLLTLATNVGVGVERAAYGDDDTPLTDLIYDVEQRFGSDAAMVVAYGFDVMIEVLGPNLLADVDPIVLPPVFDIDNGNSDIATVFLPTGPFIVDVGTTEHVGDGEFSRIVLGVVDSDGDDNDVEQLLSEMMTGRSGANLDFEFVPGIVGVTLLDISLDRITLALEDGDAIDTLIFAGEGTEAVLATLDTPADITDSASSMSFVEVGVDDIVIGGGSECPVLDLISDCLDATQAAEAIIDAAIDGDPRFDVVGFDDSRISLVVHNIRTGAADTLVLFGDIIEGLLSVRTVITQ